MQCYPPALSKYLNDYAYRWLTGEGLKELHNQAWRVYLNQHDTQ